MELDAAERSSPPGLPGSPAAYKLDRESFFRSTRTRRAINQLDGMCRDAPMWLARTHDNYRSRAKKLLARYAPGLLELQAF